MKKDSAQYFDRIVREIGKYGLDGDMYMMHFPGILPSEARCEDCMDLIDGVCIGGCDSRAGRNPLECMKPNPNRVVLPMWDEDE